MRFLALTALLLATAFAGCAATPEPVDASNDIPEVPEVKVPVGNHTVTADQNASAWVAEYSMGPYSIATFSLTVPNVTVMAFESPFVPLEIMPILPDGGTLESSFMFILDAEGELMWASSREPMTSRWRYNAAEAYTTVTTEAWQGSSYVYLDVETIGTNITLMVGIDTKSGPGAIMIRPDGIENGTSDDLEQFLGRVEGDIGVITAIEQSQGFATHLYYDRSSVTPTFQSHIEYWTPLAAHSDQSQADLRPLGGTRALSFSASTPYAGESVLFAYHSARMTGSWQVSGDLHGSPLDAGGELTASSMPSQFHSGSGSSGASFSLELEGTSPTTQSQSLNLQYMMRPPLPTVEDEPAQGNVTLDFMGNLVVPTPWGPMTVEGTSSHANPLLGRPA